MRFCIAERPDGAAEDAAPQRRATAQHHIDPEQADADGDDRVGDERGVGRVRAARPVELASRGEVVAGLLEQPGDPVRDRPALGGRRTPVRLAVRGDRPLQVAVTDQLLGDAPPAEPRGRAAGVRRGLPRDLGAGLVVRAVSRRPGQQPGLTRHVRVGMAGQRLEDGGGGLRISRVEEAAAFLELRSRFIAHSRRLCRTCERPPRIGTSAVVAQPPGRRRAPDEPGACDGVGYLARRRKSSTSS